MRNEIKAMELTFITKGSMATLEVVVEALRIQGIEKTLEDIKNACAATAEGRRRKCSDAQLIGAYQGMLGMATMAAELHAAHERGEDGNGGAE